MPTRLRTTRLRATRFRLSTLLAAVAVLALLLGVTMPRIRRAIGPNTWVVRTVTRADGSIVRLRIRRHPDHDRVYQEVLFDPPRATGAGGRLDRQRRCLLK